MKNIEDFNNYMRHIEHALENLTYCHAVRGGCTESYEKSTTCLKCIKGE